jgi:hypothetical protein
MKRATAFRATMRLAATFGVAAVVTATAADTAQLAFPLYQTHVLYAVYDLNRSKQVREAYINPEALKQVRPGEPLPNGTVLTMPVFKAVLDERDEPLRDANGRYVRGSLEMILVMEKRTGWGAEYPRTFATASGNTSAFAPMERRTNAASSKTASRATSRSTRTITFSHCTTSSNLRGNSASANGADSSVG